MRIEVVTGVASRAWTRAGVQDVTGVHGGLTPEGDEPPSDDGRYDTQYDYD
jgi:hypothetical protein